MVVLVPPNCCCLLPPSHIFKLILIRMQEQGQQKDVQLAQLSGVAGWYSSGAASQLLLSAASLPSYNCHTLLLYVVDR